MKQLAIFNAPRMLVPTRSVSLEASLSTGIMNRKKNIERIANPLAVRVYRICISGCSENLRGASRAYDDSVIPGEDGKLIKSSNKIPPRSDVAGYEDRKCEDREGVHESPSIAASPFCVFGLCCGGCARRARRGDVL
jgi:hypothetical protein